MCVRFLFVCLFAFRLSLYALREGLVELTVGETLGNVYLVIYPQVVFDLTTGNPRPRLSITRHNSTNCYPGWPWPMPQSLRLIMCGDRFRNVKRKLQLVTCPYYQR